MKRTSSRSFAKAFLLWLPLAFVATAFFGVAYILIQQSGRMSANDPQIQIAEDASRSLAEGVSPALVASSSSSLSPAASVDIATSLAPFIEVFDQSGQPLAFSGQLSGKPAMLPAGVFSAAAASGESRLTWQPEANVRIAAVVRPYGGARPGFVLAGRSLREVEKRADHYFRLALAGWAGALLGSFALSWLLSRFLNDFLNDAV